MGCSGSKVFVIRKIEGQDGDTLECLRKLHLSKKDIDKIYTAFCKFDLNGNGFIELEEFLATLDIEKTPISVEVFNEIDRSDDQKMNFKEFALNIWAYCIKSEESIASFAFDMYDTDNSQALANDEIRKMIGDCYGRRELNDQLKQIMKKMDKSGDGLITKEEFVRTAKAYPALLFPAYSMQLTFRKKICGEKFWEQKGLNAERIMNQPGVKKMFEAKGKGSKSKSKSKKTGDEEVPKSETKKKPTN